MAITSSLFPPGFVLLVASGYLVRALNRRPPFWERIIQGLRYYDELRPQEVVAALRAVAASPSSAPALAAEALDLRLRSIPFSYFPIQTVPWDSLIGAPGLSMVVATALYAAIGFTLVHVWVRTRS